MANRGLSRVPAEHLVDLGGIKYPKYAGVLLVAHEDGLSRLTTRIVQVPAKENDFVAIVEATAVMGNGDNVRIFTDCGDASPRNCTSKVATALLRMASTRAKGRALRDAIAIGQTLYEEIPEEEKAEARSAVRANGNGPTQPVTTPRPAPKVEEAPLPEPDAEPEFEDPDAVGPPPNQVSPTAVKPTTSEAIAARSCSVCKRLLTVKQRDESMAKLGKLLCPLCSREPVKA